MDTVATAQTAEEEVRELLDSYFEAIQTHDLDRIMAHYTPDVVAYDAISQFEFSGAQTYSAHWKACLDMCASMAFEPRPPAVAAHGDVAFAHCLIQCGAVDLDGNEQSGWMRATFGLRRSDGGWRIVHEHHSAPFDPETTKIISQLEP